MSPRNIVVALALAAVAAAAGVHWYWPKARIAFDAALHTALGSPANKADAHGHADGHDHADDEAPEGVIRLSDEQIASARIEIAPAGKATIARRLTVPGSVVPDADRIGRVAAKVVGTVAELRKRLGDPVGKGEVIAVLESREVADAKSDYLAALVHFDLQKNLFEREQTLWEKRISAEQQFLRARNAFAEAQLRVNVARQKLSALDLGEAEIDNLPSRPLGALRQKEIRAPLGGQVVERRVDLGAPVGGEGQEKELYVIADLSSVWIEMSVSTGDLPAIRVGQPVSVSAGADAAAAQGNIVFVSPMLNPETRTARVIASVDNKTMSFRPGSFVTAQITIEQHEVELAVPRAALQTIGGEQVLFARNAEGFEKREVVLGRTDGTRAEIVFGIDPGEPVAVSNTFVLKAELGKSAADHGHVH